MTVPNRNPQDNPDAEQERRLQARQDTEFARGERAERPPYAFVGPDSQRQTLAAGLPPSPSDTQLTPEAPVVETVSEPEPTPKPAKKATTRKTTKRS